MPLGLGLGNTIGGRLRSKFGAKMLGEGVISAPIAPIKRQLTAAMTGTGDISSDLLVTKKFSGAFTGDGTTTATVSTAQFLLDEYTGAAAAYSIRLLRAGYSGAIVRIRRSSDNAEKDFYPDSNNELSLSSEDGSGTSLSTWIGANDGFIVTKYDQSGNALDITNSTASQQMQIISSGSLLLENGKPAGQLTGNQEFVKAINWNTNLYAQFTVMKASGAGSLISLDNGNIWLRDNGTAMFSQYSSNFFNATLTNVQAAIYMGYDGTNHEYDRNDGTEALSAAATAQGTVTELSMFARRAGINRLSGSFQEAIFYLSNQLSNVSGIQSNQNEYYSIY